MALRSISLTTALVAWGKRADKLPGVSAGFAAVVSSVFDKIESLRGLSAPSPRSCGERVGVIGARLSCGGDANSSPPPCGEGSGGGVARGGTALPQTPDPPPHPSPTRGEGVAAARPLLNLAPMRVGVRGSFHRLGLAERPPHPEFARRARKFRPLPTEVGFTRLRHSKKDRNLQQPISIAGRGKDC